MNYTTLTFLMCLATAIVLPLWWRRGKLELFEPVLFASAVYFYYFVFSPAAHLATEPGAEVGEAADFLFRGAHGFTPATDGEGGPTWPCGPFTSGTGLV